MRWCPHATVAAMVELDGRFLLVEETAGGQRVINQPAGHIEPGETLADALVRETLEETGWVVQPTFLLGLYTYCSKYNGVTYHRTCFVAKALRQESERPLDEAIIRALWLSRAELESPPAPLRSPLIMRSIDDYLAGKRYPLDLIYEHPHKA
ncbi:MAG: NUDIX hydrolase [Pseudomonadota bacterium]|nr:NUDIX hydrolase [Pseudomonadota bacterium]